MGERPFASQWTFSSKKPLIQTGELKGLLGKKNNTRNAIVRFGKRHGADAFEFRGIGDNRLPKTDVVAITDKIDPTYLSGAAKVKYAGPTTGKSTFVKANPNSGFVDLDAIPEYKNLRKAIADQLGLDFRDPAVTNSKEYQEAFNNFIRTWSQDINNSGKTLLGSSKALLRGDAPLAGQAFIPDFETFVARNKARGFKETPEQLKTWYDEIIKSNPDIKIDNRFIGDIPTYTPPKTTIKEVSLTEPIMSSPTKWKTRAVFPEDFYTQEGRNAIMDRVIERNSSIKIKPIKEEIIQHNVGGKDVSFSILGESDVPQKTIEELDALSKWAKNYSGVELDKEFWDAIKHRKIKYVVQHDFSGNTMTRGWYDRKTKTIYINADAYHDLPFSHEIVSHGTDDLIGGLRENGVGPTIQDIFSSFSKFAKGKAGAWQEVRATLRELPNGAKNMSSEDFIKALNDIDNIYGPEYARILQEMNQSDRNWWVKKLQRIIETASDIKAQGGVLKAQDGAFLSTWQKAYDSNFGKGLRSILFGTDYDLSDEEYFQKHGYARPITGTVHLPMVPEEGPFMGIKYLTKGSFGTGARYNAGLERKLTEAASKKVLNTTQKPLSAWEKFIQKPIEEQNRIVKFWNGEKYSGMADLSRSEKGLAAFKRWLGKHKNGGILKAQKGTALINPNIITDTLKKIGFSLVAKRSNAAQIKSIPTIAIDVLTGRDKSFYNEDNINGSNEIDTYVWGKPYNSLFTGDVSVGPDYTDYINRNYPDKKDKIKTYNTHFGDTLYIDETAKDLVERQLQENATVGGSMGRYAHGPSYIITKEEGRPYDAGGHLMKFGRDSNGNIVANMSDIYDFLPSDFEEYYSYTKNPHWARNMANEVGTPFIVRQNNIPVIFKKILPEYNTDLQKRLGYFLAEFGDMYDLTIPKRLTDKQIWSIFNSSEYEDDRLDYMKSKGWLIPAHKSGGILKAQEGTSFVNTMLYPGNQEIAFTEYYTPDNKIEFVQEIPEPYAPQYNFSSGEKKEEKFVAAPLPEVTTTVQEKPQENVQETTPVTQRSTSTKYTDRNKFISDMTAAYAKALSKKGISTEYARRLAVQDALESNFGQSYAGNWNFGNIIVGSSGASYTEGNDTDGNGNPIKQKFRNYASLEDFVNHKIDLLNGRRYRAFDGDIEHFYDRVKAGGYATSKNYVNTLNKLYEQYK